MIIPSTGIGNKKLKILSVLVFSLICSMRTYADELKEIQFNTEVMDVEDRNHIDLGQFSRGAFIMPGSYTMAVKINAQTIPEQPIVFYAPSDDPKGSVACITKDLAEKLGLKEGVFEKLTWTRDGKCLDLKSLPGMTLHGDLPSSTLNVSIPQIYLDYVDESWDPPARWDDGIPGILMDYYVNATTQKQSNASSQYDVSGNGTLGGNLGPWRLRADWQANYQHQTGAGGGQPGMRWDWSRYYAYRAIRSIGAKLVLGETDLNSNLFDSVRFSGGSLSTDDSMLPPNLRGYAPEVTGVARTNAKVTVSQQGRVIYETQVAAGPFRIQDLNDAVTGQLDVRIQEQDGSVQEYKMDTANIPYLSRPGMVRYKIAAGRPSDIRHRTNGDFFGSGEFTWGISNGWSLYGGGIGGKDYNALALGIGRDLLILGAISFDFTESRARLPGEDKTYSGGSYRVSYSKRFDDYDSQVTFAGYRFSERDYMSMSEYLDSRNNGIRSQNSKEMYTVNLNKNFRELNLSANINYNHQTYWDRPANDRYNFTVSSYFDMWNIKNISLSLTAYRSKYNSASDDGMYLSLSLPLSNGATIGYNGSFNKNNNTNNATYYDRIDDHNSYQVSAGSARNGATASGYLTHEGDYAEVDATASYQEGAYTSAGISLQGGATATLKGAALHRTSMLGGTRLLVDADGVSNIPVKGFGPTARTNYFGKAVIADVNSYYRNNVSIDLDNMPDNAEATKSVTSATLTEGAIGYRKFNVISGEKAMAVIRLADGTTPPFGATVINDQKQEVGIISDGGSVYLSGIKADEVMSVRWDGQTQCHLHIPSRLPEASNAMSNMLLPCQLTAKPTAASFAKTSPAE